MKKLITMLLILTVTIACSDAKKGKTICSSETKQSETDVTKTDEGFMDIQDKDDFKFKVTDETDSNITGVFSFTAKEIGGTATITIRNGKFKEKIL